MEFVRDSRLLERFIDKYEIADYFTDIKKYQKGIRLIRFPKGTLLYSRNEHMRYVYFLVSGRLQVYAVSAEGRQMLLRFCEAPIFLGDMELLGYPAPSNVVETVNECLMIGLDLATLQKELLCDECFLRFLCHSLAEKLQFFANMQFVNQVTSPQQRLAGYILDSSQEKEYFKENLRKTSEVLDISYRHLHRVLGEFVDNGFLERKDRGYRIADARGLEEIRGEADAWVSKK